MDTIKAKFMILNACQNIKIVNCIVLWYISRGYISLKIRTGDYY